MAQVKKHRCNGKGSPLLLNLVRKTSFCLTAVVYCVLSKSLLEISKLIFQKARVGVLLTDHQLVFKTLTLY